MKTCTECNEHKELELFHPNKMGRLGRKSKCKECSNTKSKISYHSDLVNNRLIKAKQQAKYRAIHKESGLPSKDFTKWLELSSDQYDRVLNILTRCNQKRAEKLCFNIMTSGQDKWRRFCVSFNGDELLAEYSGI